MSSKAGSGLKLPTGTDTERLVMIKAVFKNLFVCLFQPALGLQRAAEGSESLGDNLLIQPIMVLLTVLGIT